MRTLLRRTGAAAAVTVAAAVLASGCSLPDATEAEPETTTFPFDGDVLDVQADGTPTDLVAADRGDVEVTRWIDTRGDPDVTSAWSLEDGTLRLDNSCSGVCVYDDRFRVEVPEGVRVLRDGEPTDLKGE
ncbi:hypothetical protein [Nocardiopsis suaedae]|uniref:Lipoprotein n=1 Tax=Nocardiopsis suaedae TaxID=3018444 RepID=A0ABT4TMC7_9ACTN|nr:hypothetical protein [Nocardiopsis suaedae]MDA2805257.1 hypothetical protein [Nocardiopsis suaedae]